MYSRLFKLLNAIFSFSLHRSSYFLVWYSSRSGSRELVSSGKKNGRPFFSHAWYSRSLVSRAEVCAGGRYWEWKCLLCVCCVVFWCACRPLDRPQLLSCSSALSGRWPCWARSSSGDSTRRKTNVCLRCWFKSKHWHESKAAATACADATFF